MSHAPAQPVIDTTPARLEGNVSTIVLSQVLKLQDTKTLVLPADYSPENALRAAWFHIQNSDQKDKILACTRESQINALYDMIIQGCDVSKKQGYFIPYGNRLVFQRSYFGDAHVAKRVRPGIQIYYDVVYKGEPIKLRKVTSRYGYVTLVEHEPDFPRKSKEIVGAYCGVIDELGEPMGVEIMDIDQIRTSWRKSKTYGEKSQTFHNEQPDQACLRTVIRRRCKPIINASNDSALLESVRRQEMDQVDAEMDEEIERNGNAQILTLPVAQEQPQPQPHPETTTPPAPAAAEPTPLSEAEIRKALKLNADQWQYLKECYARKSDGDVLPFLAECVATGAKDYKDAADRIDAMPDQPQSGGAAPSSDLPF